MQIEKQLSHGCSPAPPGLTSSVHFNATHVSSTPGLARHGVGYKRAHALCSHWVYKACWGDKFNHRNHLRTIQPSIWLSRKSWETDEVLEEAIEERAPCMLAGQEVFLGQRDWTRPMNGQGSMNGRDGEREWSKHSAGPSLYRCSADTLFPFPFGWWGPPHLLGLGLRVPLPRGLPQLFCLSSSPLHYTVLHQSNLHFPPAT